MLRLPQIEPANAGHQHVSHNQIEHSPQNIDHRRRQALAGRRCERALERAARNAVHQMWDRVGEKSPTEEVSDQVIPACHGLHKTSNSIVIRDLGEAIPVVDDQQVSLREALQTPPVSCHDQYCVRGNTPRESPRHHLLVPWLIVEQFRRSRPGKRARFTRPRSSSSAGPNNAAKERKEHKVGRYSGVGLCDLCVLLRPSPGSASTT